MNSIPKIILSALAVLFFANVAYAQVCKETGNNSSSNTDDEHGELTNCDMRYRDTVVTCDEDDLNNGVVNPLRPTSCPPKPMPMLKTPLKSFIKDYSPYLYVYALEKNSAKAYNGPFSTGTAGGADRVFGMIAQPAGDGKQLAGCVPQIQFSGTNNSLKERAKEIRLQLDNCTNQYIFNTAADPLHKSRSRAVNNPTKSAARTTLETDCQPLRTFSEEGDDGNEYEAGAYLEAAFIKLHENASHRKNKTAWAEPHLPKTIAFQNPLPNADTLKQKLKEVRLSQIAVIPYEEIIDPSHPFTPRWDFSFNERDRYSPLTDEYMEDTKNAVYCAGVREAKNENDKQKKADLEVKVDVLKFRQKKFNTGILKRISYNTICKQDSGDDVGSFFTNAATSYCHKTGGIYWLTWIPCIVGSCDPQSKRVECWKCFKLDGKVDDDKKHPPCSTRHDGKDLKIKHTPAFLNGFGRKASCNPVPPFTRQKKHNIDKLCSDLRRPYTQINKLKLRYHNPDDKDYNAMKDGVPEGYTFKEYFGNHMPYPRMWDTGSSLQKTTSSDGMYQPPDDTKGQYSAIVGVGREGAIEKASDDDKKLHKDERCKFGGWGDSQGSQGFIDQASGLFGKGGDGGMGGFNNIFGGSKSGDAFGGMDLKGITDGLQKDSKDNVKIFGQSIGSGTNFNFDIKKLTENKGGASGGFNFGSMDFGSLGDNLGGGNLAGNFSGALNNMTGPSVMVGGSHKIRLPDGITSWTELKLYQVHTLRSIHNMSCLGRYEKVFKPGSSENLALTSLGGEWSRMIVQECQRSNPKDCKFKTLEEYRNSGANSNANTITQLRAEGWPLAWRGYIAAGANDPDQFPKFGGTASLQEGLDKFGGTASLQEGLDNAELGDIVLMPNGVGPSGTNDKPGLPKVAIVTEVNLPSNGKCMTRGDCYVQVMEADNGKWPDACGTTDSSGEMKTRYFYKQGHLPKPAREEYDRIGSTYSCEDTKLSKCVVADREWNSLKLYRVAEDYREGCDKEKASECKDDE